MKIKLKESPPVDPVHGLKEGDVYEILREVRRGYVVRAASGEEVTILYREAERID